MQTAKVQKLLIINYQNSMVTKLTGCQKDNKKLYSNQSSHIFVTHRKYNVHREKKNNASQDHKNLHRRIAQGLVLAIKCLTRNSKGPRTLNGSGVGQEKFAISSQITSPHFRNDAKLLLITNMKSHMPFTLMPKSTTLDDLEWTNMHSVAEKMRLLQPTAKFSQCPSLLINEIGRVACCICPSSEKNKTKDQLSPTNPCDAYETFARFT